jgi:hypothetical protein
VITAYEEAVDTLVGEFSTRQFQDAVTPLDAAPYVTDEVILSWLATEMGRTEPQTILLDLIGSMTDAEAKDALACSLNKNSPRAGALIGSVLRETVTRHVADDAEEELERIVVDDEDTASYYMTPFDHDRHALAREVNAEVRAAGWPR